MGGSDYIRHTPHNEYPPSIRVLCSAVLYSGAQKECSPNILVLYGGELLCSGAPHILVLYWGSYEGVAKANTRGGGLGCLRAQRDQLRNTPSETIF